MYAIERKANIIAFLESEGEVRVNELSAHFQVSKETIRRDLRELEREGILTRTHGGGTFNRAHHALHSEYPVSIRSIQRFAEKNAICHFAATFIEDGDTIFVDNSSTTIYLLQNIPRYLRVTVLTNSVKLLFQATQISNANINYIGFGGSFKESNLSFYGNATLKHAGLYYPGKAFLGCAGLTRDGIATDSSIHEADTKQLMIRHSKKVFYLADHTKLNAKDSVFLAQLQPEDQLITDYKADRATIDSLQARGISCTLVPLKNGIE